MLYLNIWLICGLIAYLKLVYINKLDKEDMDIPIQQRRSIIFITCMLGGIITLFIVILFDIWLLYIEVEYLILSLYCRIFKK